MASHPSWLNSDEFRLTSSRAKSLAAETELKPAQHQQDDTGPDGFDAGSSRTGRASGWPATTASMPVTDTVRACQRAARDMCDLAFPWFERMVDPHRLRFYYTRSPAGPAHAVSPIRDIATVYDVSKLTLAGYRSEVLGKAMLSTLHHYLPYVSMHDRPAEMSPVRAGSGHGPTDARIAVAYWRALPDDETPTIAHSAFMSLGLLSAARLDAHPDRMRSLAMALAEGIWRQRVTTGSDAGRIKILLPPAEHDTTSGEEFYPGEAMLALAHAFPERAADLAKNHAYYMHRFEAKRHAHIATFFANWMCQSADAIHTAAMKSGDDSTALAMQVACAHLGHVLASGAFVQRVRNRSVWRSLATVEVAVVAEALAHVLAVIPKQESASHDGQHSMLVGEVFRALLDCIEFLQAVRNVARLPDMYGGYPHAFDDNMQRIDVTGHVINGMTKLLARYPAASVNT